MKIIDCEQGSADWFRARLGIPTASAFDQIVTPVTGKLSKSADRYAYRLIAERLLNTPLDTMEGQTWMERGKELEPAAVSQYEFVEDVETVPVGFITTDDGLIGASPDRLIKGAPRGLEIKCPSPQVHLGYLLDGHTDAYRPQVQGQLYVAELERVDFYSYHPRMPACLISTTRDEEYIAKLRDALAQFNERLFGMLERAKALGVFQAYEHAVTPTERERATELRAELLDEFGIPA
jgi:hypothetical protein